MLKSLIIRSLIIVCFNFRLIPEQIITNEVVSEKIIAIRLTYVPR